MQPLPLNRLLMLQMGYAFVGIMYNVGSLLAVRNDQAAWASTDAVAGVAGMSLYGLFLAAGLMKNLSLYRLLMGASVLSIVSLFAKTYVRLLLLAFVIGLPVSYYLMDGWLRDFEYRITISPFIFFTSLIVLLVISVGISTFHSIRASLMDPAKVLRDE